MPPAPARTRRLLLTLTAVALATALASLALGPAAIGPASLAAAFGDPGDPLIRAIVLELRLPRTLVALIVGAMLGLGGAALQGYLRNPLAEPSVLGASGMAALGAVIALYFGLALAHPWLLPLLAIAGALVALLPLHLLAARSEGPLALILAGVAISTLAGAGISLALNLAPSPFAVSEIMAWLLGSLDNATTGDLLLAAPCVAVAFALLLADGRALDALSLGEDAARTLGTNLAAVRLRLLAGLAIGIGGAVAVSGAIGFVGLVVPHLVRPFTDRSPSAALIPSALGGAALLLLADIAVRLIPTATSLRLGVLTAFLGVPVFLHLLLRERRLW